MQTDNLWFKYHHMQNNLKNKTWDWIYNTISYVSRSRDHRKTSLCSQNYVRADQLGPWRWSENSQGHLIK